MDKLNSIQTEITLQAVGYEPDKPAYQFSKDELNLMYFLGWIDEKSYHSAKQKLEQRIGEYNCCKHNYLFML